MSMNKHGLQIKILEAVTYHRMGISILYAYMCVQLERHWHKQEKETCLPNKEYISGHK